MNLEVLSGSRVLEGSWAVWRRDIVGLHSAPIRYRNYFRTFHESSESQNISVLRVRSLKTLNPKPETLNPKPQTLYPKP